MISSANFEPECARLWRIQSSPILMPVGCAAATLTASPIIFYTICAVKSIIWVVRHNHRHPAFGLQRFDT